MSNVVKKEGDALALSPNDSILLEMVKRSDIDPDRLEKLMELQFKHEAHQAEKAFNAALSSFQGECPIIDKSKNVSFKSVNYDYSPIEEIAAVIKPILNKYGLSYSFNVKAIDDNRLELITKIRHIDGHSEETSYFFNKYHDDDRMNHAQRQKSSVTFAKRAALENALGLTTAKEDDDTMSLGQAVVTPDQIKEIKALLVETKSDQAKFLKFVGAENIDALTGEQAKKALHALKQKRVQNV